MSETAKRTVWGQLIAAAVTVAALFVIWDLAKAGLVDGLFAALCAAGAGGFTHAGEYLAHKFKGRTQ